MTYHRETNTFTVAPNSDFLVDSGVAFVCELEKDALRETSPSGIVDDWKVVQDWLGCYGRALNGEDEAKITAAWRAYLARGVAPSVALQPIFDDFSNECQRNGLSYVRDNPPTGVMDVFDRLIASDVAIKAKREQDWRNERLKFQNAMRATSPKAGNSWWRDKSKAFRVWVFGSAVWALLVLLFFVVFDPHNYGAWEYMSGSDYLQMYCIMAMPLIGGAIKLLYDRLVK